MVVKEIFGAFGIILNYIVKSFKRKPRLLLIGIFTVTIVVFFIGVLENAVKFSSIIFWNVAEDQASQSDFTISPPTTTLYGIGHNFESISGRLKSNKNVEGFSPRIIVPGRCSFNGNFPSCVLVLQNTKREKDIGVGRDWKLPALNSGEMHLSNSLCHQFGVSPGSTIDFDFGTMDEMFSLLAPYISTEISVRSPSMSQEEQQVAIKDVLVAMETQTRFPFRLVKCIEDRKGKYAPMGDVLLTELPLFGQTLTAYADRIIDQVLAAPASTASGIAASAVLSMKAPNVSVSKTTEVASHLWKDETNHSSSVPIDISPLPTLASLSNFTSIILPSLPAPSPPSSLSKHSPSLPSLSGTTPFNIEESFTEIVGVFKKRVTLYWGTIAERNNIIRERSDDLYRSIGIDSDMTIRFSTFAEMESTNNLQINISQLFTSMVIVMAGLGSVLIYTLMLSDIEEKTYEYGMLRALGLSKKSFSALLVTTTQFFSIPGTAIAVGLSALVVGITVAAIGAMIGYPIPMYFEGLAVLLCLLIGLVLPLAANFMPIVRAVTSTLRDSLDLYHTVANETTVTFTDLATMGISPQETLLAIIVIVCGFLLFYWAPISYFNQDTSVFLFILTWMLIGMLVGLMFMAIFFLPFAERLFAYALLIWNPHERRLLGLVKKSLDSHRPRNTKTAIMFTSTLAFIIFSGSQFGLQSKQISDSQRVTTGSDIVFTAPSIRAPFNFTTVMPLLAACKNQYSKYIYGYSYSTFPLSAFPDVIGGVRLSNMNGQSTVKVDLYGVGESYLEGTFTDFYLVDAVHSDFTYPTIPDQTNVKREQGSKINIDGSGGKVGSNIGYSKKDVFASVNRNPRSLKLEVEDKINILSSLPNILSNTDVGTALKPAESVLQTFPNLVYKSNAQFYADHMDLIVSRGILQALSIDIETPVLLNVDIKQSLEKKATSSGGSVETDLHVPTGVREKRQTYALPYLGKIRGSLNKAPGTTLGKNAATAPGTAIPVSAAQYTQILTDAFTSTDQVLDGKWTEVPFLVKSLYVLLKVPTTLAERDMIVEYIRGGIGDGDVFSEDYTVSDINSLISTVSKTTVVLDIFFVIFGVLSVTMCFFVLVISFTSNVRENAWEFGVLRSLGLTGWTTIRVYVYEALALVLSGILFGTIVGIIIGITLTIQSTMMTELPFGYIFPVVLYVIVLVLSLLVAVFGSIIAAWDMKEKDIASVIRSGV